MRMTGHALWAFFFVHDGGEGLRSYVPPPPPFFGGVRWDGGVGCMSECICQAKHLEHGPISDWSGIRTKFIVWKKTKKRKKKKMVAFFVLFGLPVNFTRHHACLAASAREV